ncbi:hypothetical protein KKG36_01110 [Patescibacteria group bacterium]|nr:hypothetical protein [Patescibacteria group bacterium]
MAELIALLIFLVSLLGLIHILHKKAPILAQMPDIHEGMLNEGVFERWVKKIKDIQFDKLVFLKALSKTRVFVLKAEKIIDNHLQKARKRIAKKQSEKDKPV